MDCLHQLEIKFNGTLEDATDGTTKGFFYYEIEVDNDTTRYAASTQLAPTDARRVFPCWDEPNFKATFDVILIVPNDRMALSNMACSYFRLIIVDCL